LPFTQDGERLLRKYKKDEALKRLEEIKKLKEKDLRLKKLLIILFKGKNFYV